VIVNADIAPYVRRKPSHSGKIDCVAGQERRRDCLRLRIRVPEESNEPALAKIVAFALSQSGGQRFFI
jgi:hypothetical protein